MLNEMHEIIVQPMFSYRLHFTNGAALAIGTSKEISFQEASLLYSRKGLTLSRLELVAGFI